MVFDGKNPIFHMVEAFILQGSFSILREEMVRPHRIRHKRGIYCGMPRAACKRAKEEGREAAFLAWAEYTGECDYGAIEDTYCGEAESEEDYAPKMVKDNGLLNDLPQPLNSYFDSEAYARDLF